MVELPSEAGRPARLLLWLDLGRGLHGARGVSAHTLPPCHQASGPGVPGAGRGVSPLPGIGATLEPGPGTVLEIPAQGPAGSPEGPRHLL